MKKLGLLVLLLFAAFSAHAAPAVVSGVTNRNLTINSSITLVPTILAGQCQNMTLDTYGSFHKCVDNTFSDSIGIAIDFRWQEVIKMLAWLYVNDPTGTYIGNKTLLKSAIVGGDDLVFGVDDNSSATPSWEWSEYGGWKAGANGRVSTFFSLGEWLSTWRLINSSIETFCFEEDSSNNLTGEGTAACGGIQYGTPTRFKWVNDTTVLNTTFFVITGGSNDEHNNVLINSTGTRGRSWDIDNDTIIDAFVNVTWEYYDNFTGNVQIYWANQSAVYVWHDCDIAGTNSSTWKNISCYFSPKGLPVSSTINNSAARNNDARMYQRNNGSMSLLPWKYRPTGSDFIVKRVTFNYTRGAEWNRVARGVCDHIMTAYSNPAYIIPVSNQWLGGTYSLLLCAERFNNQTMNTSALIMLNRTLASPSGGEHDGIFSENYGVSGNYQKISMDYATKLCNDFPFTCPILDGPMSRAMNITSYLPIGANVSLQETGFGTRTSSNISAIAWTDNCGSLGVFYGNQSVVNKRLLQLYTNNSQIVNLSRLGSSHYFTLDANRCVDAYIYWKNYTGGATPLPQENDSGTYAVVFPLAKLFTVKTVNYTCWGTFGSDYPRAQVASCYDLSGRHFFSGKQNDLNSYAFNISAGNFSNLYEEYANVTVNGNDPFNITINGRLKNPSGATKRDGDDNTSYTYNVSPSTYIPLHKDTPTGRIVKTINLTSNVSSILTAYITMFTWENYASTLYFQLNGNNSCNYTIGSDNEWQFNTQQIVIGCLRDGLNNITLTNFSAGEQVRIAYTNASDFNRSAASNDSGATWNYSKINPRGSVPVDGEYAIYLQYDTLEINNSFSANYVFYPEYISVKINTSSALNITIQTVSSQVLSGVVLSKNPRKINNLTIATTENSSLIAGSVSAQYGTLDRISSSGSDIFYIFDVGNSVNNTFADQVGANINLPLSIANISQNLINITSNTTFDLKNFSITISTGGVTPSSPLLTFPNGSSQNLSYSYGNGTVSLSISILPPGQSNVSLDTVGPVVSLLSPADGSASAGGTVTFSFLPLDDNNISNCSLLYGNGQVYTSSLSVTNNGSNSFIATGVDSHHPLGGAPLSWSVSCTDVFGNVGTSSVSRVVTVASSGGGSSGGGSSTGTTVNTSANTTTAGSVNASVNASVASRHIELTSDPKDQTSRRNFLLVVLGGMTMLILAIVILSFTR
jgi:hypothetical protein